MQSNPLSLPAGLLAASFIAFNNAPAFADVEFAPPATEQAAQTQNQSQTFGTAEAPLVKEGISLPEGNQWRYSEFIEAVEKGKVERVRFSKDGSQLQVCTQLPTLPRDANTCACCFLNDMAYHMSV